MVKDTQKLKELLILGIDPGTTIAYAILDINSNIIEVKSIKNYNFSSLILDIIRYGKVLLIGTDVKYAPYLIKKISKKIGSKIIVPDHDLRVEEKKELTKDYKNLNEHERDALASAIFAFKRKRNLFNKIDNYLIKKDRIDLRDKIIESSILTKMTITEIFNSLEKPKEEIKPKRKRQKTKVFIKEKKDEITLLKNQNQKLINEINKLRYKLNKRELDIDQKINEALKFKEKRIQQLNEEIQMYIKEIDNLKNRINTLYSYLKLTNRYLLVDKIDNLSRDIKEELDNILFVINPNIFSEKFFSIIKDKINIIIYKIEPNSIIKDKINQILIDFSKLNIIEDNDFILVDKDLLNKEISKANILSNVLKDYKKERTKTLYNQA